MAKNLIDKIPRYNSDNDDCPSDYIAIFYANKEEQIERFFQVPGIAWDLDWVIITGGAIITVALRYNMELYVGRKN